jgi:hypothetical protein
VMGYSFELRKRELPHGEWACLGMVGSSGHKAADIPITKRLPPALASLAPESAARRPRRQPRNVMLNVAAPQKLGRRAKPLGGVNR